MAVRHVRPHIARLVRHHAQHKKQILRFVHAIRRHPGAYMQGYRPSRAAMPKSFPRKPRGLHKEASGFWDFAKKGWEWVKSKFHQHKGKIIDEAKKAGKKVGARVYDAGKRVGGKVVDRMVQVAENNVEHYVQKAENKLESMGAKAEAKLEKWDRKTSSGMPGKTVAKKGSGYLMDSVRAAARRYAIGRSRIPAQGSRGRFAGTIVSGRRGRYQTIGARAK